MSIFNRLISCCPVIGCLLLNTARADEGIGAGPLYSNFPLTLGEGRRTEVLGPLFYTEQDDSQRQWGIPPLGLSSTVDPDVESMEFDLLYPLLTYDRFGGEYRWQFFQLWSFAGGRTVADGDTRRFTLFPIYFQQRSSQPELNYTALLPLYGHLRNRLFRDQIDFVLLPLYVKSQKRDVTTWNAPYPFFHLRKGDGLHGWQFWPLFGTEHKEVTTLTNGFGDTETVGGHDKLFVLWPFFTDSKTGLGTDNPAHEQGLTFFYSFLRSKLRDSTSWLWPLGVTHTVDREKKYEEWDAPWPLIEFAHGEGKTTRRVWPFYSRAHNQYLEDDWCLWPVYKYNRVTATPLDRERTRILFYLYSDTTERDTENHREKHRSDLWPLYTKERDFKGGERLIVLSPLEPIFPASKSIRRDYSPLLALWRAEKNPTTGTASQSLLWNLWRRDTAAQTKKISLLFGLFQYQSSPAGEHWRLCYVPFGVKNKTAPH